MNPELAAKIERLERQLPRWEKGLFACYGAAFTLLANGFIKAIENTTLSSAIFFIEKKVGGTNFPAFYQYHYDLSLAYRSPWWFLLWLVLEIATLTPAIILAVSPTWRKIPLNKRLDVMFGYFLAAWLVLLSLGARDPLNVGAGYNFLVIGCLLALGLGYWWSHRKQASAEEVFP